MCMGGGSDNKPEDPVKPKPVAMQGVKDKEFQMWKRTRNDRYAAQPGLASPVGGDLGGPAPTPTPAM